MNWYSLGDTWLGTTCELSHRIVDFKLNVIQQCNMAAKKTNAVVCCIDRNIIIKS